MSTADVAIDRTRSGERARRLSEIVFRMRELGIVLALLLLIAVTAILEPRFIELDSLKDLARNASIIAIIAAGQTMVILTRNIDLSVGSVLGLAASSAATCSPTTARRSSSRSSCASCPRRLRRINGVLTTFGKIPALVVTLGTMYIFRGIAFVYTDGRQINAETLPDKFLDIGTGTMVGIPTIAVIASPS